MQFLIDLLTKLGFGGTFISGAVFATVIILYVFKHPEKFEKWLAIIAHIVSKVWKGASYFAIKHDLQSKINSFVGNINLNTTANFPGVSIKWSGKDNEELIWEEGKIVLVMRDRNNQSKNFVHAAYFFTSEVLLRKSKTHLSKTQKLSIDLFATQKILEKESANLVEQFMKDYFSPEVEKSDDLRNFIKQYISVDKVGIFFPILVQELSYLGNKIFLDKPNAEVIEEVKSLISFLETFSKRNVGDTQTQDTFTGKYMRSAIKIVASKNARERGDVVPHKERVSECLKNGFENVYMIGSGGFLNKRFMNKVLEAVKNDHPETENVKTYSFKGLIYQSGTPKKVDTYLIHLRNSEAVRYILNADDLKNSETC